MAFHYFSDPLNFAYLLEDSTPCEFCGSTSHRLDGKHLYGGEAITAVCFDCLDGGKLIDRDVSTNSVDLKQVCNAVGDELAYNLAGRILYRTPNLPTWQDTHWPFVEGDFATFIKIASKVDFIDQYHFNDTILTDGILEPDPDWQWEMLPDHPVTTLKEGQYDVSIYLFRRKDRLLTIWDAN